MKKESKKETELLDKLVVLFMHNPFHLPIKHYGFDEDGVRVLIKQIYRRDKDCFKCNELYSNLPVPTNLL